MPDYRVEPLALYGLMSPAEGPNRPSDQVHVRIWLDESIPPEVSAATLIVALNPGGDINLELWDVRPVVLDRLRALAIPSRLHGTTAVVQAVPIAKLQELLGTLAGESFGAWLGIDTERLAQLVSQSSDADRAAQMGKDAAFVVFSLYDDNIEVIATGKVATKVRALAQS